MSQGFAVAVIDVPLAFGTPVEPVRAIMQRVGDEVHNDPAFTDDIEDEPEVVGVEAMNRDGLTLRLTMKTAPLRQWAVSRRLRERISEEMDRAGLERLSVARQAVVGESPAGAAPGSGPGPAPG